MLLVGDVNIRLERATNPATSRFTELLVTDGLVCCVTAVTRDLGGTLDSAALREDMPLSIVDILCRSV